MPLLQMLLVGFVARVESVRRRGSERGDVPGWVLITAMTVALTLAVWAVARQQIVSIVTKALDGVNFN